MRKEVGWGVLLSITMTRGNGKIRNVGGRDCDLMEKRSKEDEKCLIILASK